MNTHVFDIESQLPVNPIVPESTSHTEGSLTWDQLLEDQAIMKPKLYELKRKASELMWISLEDFKKKARDVKRELDKIMNHQEELVFPEVHYAIGGRLGMISVMEQDRVLADHYFESFLEAREVQEALSSFQQMCLIIAERIRKVEDIIFPLMKWH